MTIIPLRSAATQALDQKDRTFYVAYAGAAWVAVLLGFGPRTLSHLTGATAMPPMVVHVHAAVFVAWLGLVTLQLWLIGSDRRRLHRNLGYVGMPLALMVVAAGVAVSVTMTRIETLKGDAGALGFLFDELMEMLTFAALTTAAIWLRGTPQAHARLMLLMLIGLTTPAFARSLGHALAPIAGAHPDSFWGQLIHLYPGPDFMILGALAYDKLAHGRIHPVYRIVVPVLLVNQVLTTAVCHWPVWIRLAHLMVFGP